ncbi:Calcipressin-domain-containing protein [Mycena sp. CBHHK59/15]|nr:Calcipressin-domain-containing protein [Mycena sp. CBHHK59/15]KAJ6630218.1 Calcipressin-domain-containing protein [Mycena sp. CBHHK59/15]
MAASYFISLSSPASPSSSNDVQRTNTLAVTMPKEFFQPLFLDVLWKHFATFGEINRWVLLPSFGRIIIVYTLEDDAETAKVHCDPIVLEQTQDRSQIVLRVYRADPNPLLAASDDVVPEANYLRPPAIEKNFLISPPGSPPVGWEPIKEEPPNATPLADDLMAALRKLQVHEKHPSGLEVLIEPHDGGSGVGVYVQDCDGEDDVSEEDWVYGETAPARAKWRPVTVMPPMHATVV